MNTISVIGAGSIGCYVGGCLAASGSQVRFIGRPRIAQELAEHGLTLSDYLGRQERLAPEQIDFSESIADAGDSQLVLVCVKSAATADVAQALAAHLPTSTPIISFQNGLHNAQLLREFLPEHTVIAGMVPFNVAPQGQGRFHQGTEGQLDCAADAALEPFIQAFADAGLKLHQHRDMPAILWAKLLLNLNNSINALSGIPLKQELSQRSYRRCLALAQSETLELLQGRQIQPARLTPLPPQLLPKLLQVPDFLFSRLANKMLEIDPLARSSMWEDLENGRKTEIDWINGEVVKLAQSLNQRAPVNQMLISLIRDAEAGGRRDWSGAELFAQLSAAKRETA